LDGVRVDIRDVRRGGLACKKVDFEIPPQPHGRHVRGIRAIVAASGAPDMARARADAAFMAIATIEGRMHGVSPESVHLHEVGAVDAILDVVGALWGFELLGVTEVYCGPLSVGDGTVEAAHGTLPVPAPATLALLEGQIIRPGPPGAGELVTPTGAALVHVLSSGQPPVGYRPVRSGFGAGTKDFAGRANALRLILAEVETLPETLPAAQDGRQVLVTLTADLDDMSGEYVANVADALRTAGALDVVLMPTIMKKGRPGVRVEVLAAPALADRLESMLLADSTTLGVRRTTTERRALPRTERTVEVLGYAIRVKVAVQPDGTERAKPEFDDVRRVAEATGRAAHDIFSLAAEAARHPSQPLGE
jgi:uncharacterized protein (TIGR00299 family) protein